MSVLVVAEQVGGRVREVTYELITAARELGGPVAVAVIGPDPAALDVDRAGVDEVIRIVTAEAEFENDVHRAALEALIGQRRPRVVLAGFTVNAMGFAPGVAVKLGLGFASDVFAIATEGEAVVATRAFFGGKLFGTLEFTADRPVLLLLRPTAWPPALDVGHATTCDVEVPPVASRARHVGFEEVAVSDVDISRSEFLVSIGRGIEDKDNIPLFERVAEKLGATLSASRPLVDAGWMPRSRQVGQSGHSVTPKVYLAFGISGAVQHVAGMKTSGTIIAINSDPEAAIFGVAHFGAVADAFDVADELDKLV